MGLQNNILKVSVFHKNDYRKIYKKALFSQETGPGWDCPDRRGHVCEGILITPQRQNFGGPVSCQVRLCSQQGPPISETNEQSGRWSRKEPWRQVLWEELVVWAAWV